MKKVLVLGAGMVAGPLVQYLLEKGHQVTVASRTVSKAEKHVGGHPNGKALELLATDREGTDRHIAGSDIAISLLPPDHHVQVAEMCLQHGKHMATTSYVSEEMRALDAPARERGVVILNEFGVDPGTDHMSAMRVFDDVAGRGGRITSFRSYCGGLPAPDANTNPWGYKFSWSPKGVLLAGRNAARYLQNGDVVDIAGPDLFDHHWDMPGIPDAEALEAYPNRDSMPYKDLYGLDHAATVFRGTLRYPGWCTTLKLVADLGLLEEKPLTGGTWAALMRSLVGGSGDLRQDTAARCGIAVDSDPMSRFDWLGLFADEALPATDTILDALTDLMLRKMPYTPGERDMIVLYHEFIGEFDDKREHITSTMIDFGIPNGFSSMARTVSLPCAIGVNRVLEGTFRRPGLHIPVMRELYEPVLDELESMNIKFVERTRTEPKAQR
jgi:saccharopine dehydrogenase-like NADP-dependent oxidoreductase